MREVREAQRRGLVRDAERVAEVLDRESLLLLGLLQERDRCVLRHEARRGEVVDLEPLPQELVVARGRRVPEQAVRHRLQRHRPQAVAAGDRRRRQVDAPVREVGDRAGGVGQVVHVDELEPESLGHDAHLAVRERAACGGRPPRPAPRRAARSRAGGCRVAHALAQLGVGAPRLLGGRDRLARAALQLAVQADDRRERLVGDAAAGSDRREARGSRTAGSTAPGRARSRERPADSAPRGRAGRARSTSSAAASASSVDSFGSRLPFSMSESWLPARPTASPSWSSVSPRSPRK